MKIKHQNNLCSATIVDGEHNVSSACAVSENEFLTFSIMRVLHATLPDQIIWVLFG